MFKLVERYFWILCPSVTLLGLLAPAVGRPLSPFIKVFLAGILFFTGLKLDFRAAARELRRPLLLAYVSAMMLLAMPLATWLLARMVLPDFALGLLILAAMPAGMATASFTDIIRGNAALAMVVTLATCMLCPLTAPAVVQLVSPAARGGGSVTFFLHKVAFLAGILLAPMAAAWAVRRLAPTFVARHRQSFTGLSIISLALLILGAMSDSSPDALALFRNQPGQAVGLMAALCSFTVLSHVIGYWLAPWRPPADRMALSINAAYVNNALGIVFARQFFVSGFGAAAVLPSILLEIPMVLAIPVVGAVLTRIQPANHTGPEPTT